MRIFDFIRKKLRFDEAASQQVDWDKVEKVGNARVEALSRFGVRSDSCVHEAREALQQLGNQGVDGHIVGSGVHRDERQTTVTHAWVENESGAVIAPEKNREDVKRHYRGREIIE